MNKTDVINIIKTIYKDADIRKDTHRQNNTPRC